MKVMKFGGTSVGNAERMAQVAELVCNGERNLVVLSAMAGDTNALIRIAEHLANDRTVEAFAEVTELYKKYTTTIGALINDQMTATVALGEIDNHLAELSELNSSEIVAKGEVISTTLMYYYLLSENVKAVLLPALVFMRTLPDGTPDYTYIKEKLTALIARTDAQVIITQGFICRDANGCVSNLQRGGSDFTATIIGSVINADEIQIWTDIDGIHNNDPRYVEGTHPIRRLSHAQASALAFFGAKILHPLCIEPAEKAAVPVRLLNTLDPSAPGSLIAGTAAEGHIIAVAARKGTTQHGTLTFADSSDTYPLPDCEAEMPADVAAVCIVGDISADEVREMLHKAEIEAFRVDASEGKVVAIVSATDKVRAMKEIK